MRRLALLFCLLGCGDGAIVAGVGTPCADSTACESRSTSACIAIWPDGYCTEVDCSIGSCGDGAVCTSGLSFSGVSLENFCLATCQNVNDCRTGYSCVDVSQPNKVCVPENPR